MKLWVQQCSILLHISARIQLRITYLLLPTPDHCTLIMYIVNYYCNCFYYLYFHVKRKINRKNKIGKNTSEYEWKFQFFYYQDMINLLKN